MNRNELTFHIKHWSWVNVNVWHHQSMSDTFRTWKTTKNLIEVLHRYYIGFTNWYIWFDYMGGFFILSTNSILTNVQAKSSKFGGQMWRYFAVIFQNMHFNLSIFWKMTAKYLHIWPQNPLDFVCTFVNVEFVDKIKNPPIYVKCCQKCSVFYVF